MTKLEALINARDMWEWLRNNPEASKTDYFVDNDIHPIPYSKCYLCEYCKEEEYDEDGELYLSLAHCENCPVQWTDYPQEYSEEIFLRIVCPLNRLSSRIFRRNILLRPRLSL